ncbi:TIM-barrel domain-containing protein [Clostridium sp. JS66]|uniref:TIM-barrel domain-containing protein n=1 Tax=Clostridium sp. JS66 TaxID=3064705 RepID=UPI00298E8644|nr:TIM-barrel domain-containing protein [Clostridium sp. JS66]WPC41563.1 glycoside hydrolase family 31 protein [Clostridium sp. JS66]
MKTYKVNDSVIKYTFGNPIKTDAITINNEQLCNDPFEFFQVTNDKELKFTYIMNNNDVVWGLGENQRGMNKRGGIYESFCSDDPIHTPNKKSLYGAHNFIIVDGKNKFGIFVDFPGKVIFDIGFTIRDELKIIIEDKSVDVYMIHGKSSKNIVNKFLEVIGESYVPPKWAFGYQQSRWGYKNEKSIYEIIDKFIENNIPCDAIDLDIDYMEGFKDFTIDKKAFPDFKDFVKKVKDKGFRLIPIIDAGIKIESGYDVYEEGVTNNYFCTDEAGKNFIAAVWPGKCHFPDFLNSKVRKWFGYKYKILTDMGIEGFWNDMNEPAIFYTSRGLDKIIQVVKDLKGKNLDSYSFFELESKFLKMSNSIEDYKSFYHNIDGKIINHYKVHNLFGFNMTRSAKDGLSEIQPNKRFLLFSRASYIGMHRYGGIWTGDNSSWWEHILLNIKMMPSLNMCGFLYTGADTGGFSGDANGELAIRWTQFSVFTPLFRNHSAQDTRYQEPFSFEEKVTFIIKKAIEIRYALIPYIYSEYMKAIINKDMYFFPLAFIYKDEMSRRIENQLLVGDSLMITPIYEENSLGRYIYLPQDMLLWKAKDYRNRKYNVIKKGHRYINVDIDEIPIFIRKDKMLVLGNCFQSVEKLYNTELNIIAFVENRATYIYHDDDGKTYDYKMGVYSNLIIEIEKIDKDYLIKVQNKGNTSIKRLNFEVININGEMYRKIIYLKE